MPRLGQAQLAQREQQLPNAVEARSVVSVDRALCGAHEYIRHLVQRRDGVWTNSIHKAGGLPSRH